VTWQYNLLISCIDQSRASVKPTLTDRPKIARLTSAFFRGILFADKLLEFNARERSTVLPREKLVTMATVTLGSARHCLRSDSASAAGGIRRTHHWSLIS